MQPLIVLCEPHPVLRRLVAGWLEAEGMKVKAVQSAAAAQSLLASRRRPKLVICDGAIEGREHSEVQQARTAAGGKVPILALLPSSRIEDFARSYADGATAVLPRPFTHYQLTQASRRLCSRPHLPREKQPSDPLLGL